MLLLQSLSAFAALASMPVALSHPSILRAISSRATTLPPSNHCGDYDYVIVPDTPWIVYNMLYNADVTVGTQCTYFDHVTTAADGTQEVVWSSATDIEFVTSTDNVPKGYSFVGLTENLETTITDIASIPATYDWTRTNTTTFKGNVCFDFMTSDTKGDSTSTAAQELMLWLQYEGGQLPIGWGTPAATIDSLYGTSWKLYEGVNDDTGITVHSLLPDVQFDGSFTGDIKDWLEAMVTLGRFTESTYVNVGNAGTEFFYGDSILNATLGLQINLGTSDPTSSTTSSTTIGHSLTSSSVASTATTTTIATSASVAEIESTITSTSTPASSVSAASTIASTTSTPDECTVD